MPELAPRFLYERSPDGNEEGVGFGVRLSIPLWNRNEAEVGRARSQLSLAETELAVFDKLDLENIIKALHAQALDSQTRAMNYRNDILPSYEKSYGPSRCLMRGSPPFSICGKCASGSTAYRKIRWKP